MNRETKELVSAIGERFKRELGLEASLPARISQGLSRLHEAERERASHGPAGCRTALSTDR
jgi:hypothetical protein